MIRLAFKMIFGVIKFVMALIAIIIGCCLGVGGFIVLFCFLAVIASIYSPKMTT